jgi:outer membrane receptor protein involved in Fe transport
MGNNYLKADHALQTVRLSAFVQDKWSFGTAAHPLFLIGGIRLSYWNFNNEIIVTPRLRLIYQPEIKADVSFYLATGMYYQPSFYKEMRLPTGELNKDIQSQKSYHVITGVDYLFKIRHRPFKFSTEIYYKYLQDLITYTMDNVRIIYSGENDATGYATGVDAKLSGEIVHNLESWIAISLMKSMERIRGADDYTPRPTDQRFSINLFFQDKVPKLPMLKAHIILIYSTPLPNSPPMVRIYRKGSHHYFRTDIGFSWQFIDEATRLGKKNPFRFLSAGYLTFEIANVFNYKNVLSYSWISNWEGAYFKIPNYLTPRLFNAKLRFEF